MQLTLDDFIIDSNPWNYMRKMFLPAPLMLTEDPEKTARIINFNNRKEARIDGLRAAAERRYNEADRRLSSGWGKLDNIPFGQPIIGTRDRNYRDKARRQIDRGYEIMKEAAVYEERAKAAEKNHAISSDDPMAIEKLTEKLEGLQKGQETMKRINAYYRKHGSLEGCTEDPTAIKAAKENLKISWHTRPFESYSLSNNNAEIRRIKERIAELQNRQPASNYTGDGWHSEEDPDDNRIRIYFDGKPDEATRSKLKSNGFRWSPRNNAWQRQISVSGRYAMKCLSEILN